jgi:hypothetical protein
MRWDVEGADTRTGQDRILTIEAESSARAEAQAREQGLLVSAVRQRAIPIDAQNEVPPLEVIAAELPRTASVEYARPMDQTTPPDYRGLRIGATFLRIFAFASYALGAIAIIQLIVSLFQMLLAALQFGGSPFRSDLVETFVQAVISLWPLLIGVLLQSAADACRALRDIARNSFPVEK